MSQEPLRVLFVGRSIGHFTYYDSVLAALCGSGAQVELLLDKKWSSKWVRGLDMSQVDAFKARYPNFELSWLARRADGWRDLLFELRELRTYRSYLVRPETTPFYVKRWRAFLDPKWKVWADRPWFDPALKSAPAEWVLRAIERVAPADPSILALLKEKRPDIMVCSPMNLRYSEEVDYAKAAKQLGVPVAAITISWDNLSTKGLFHVEPDRLFVWNKYQYEDALKIQRIEKARVEISGSPFFDKWFSPSQDVLERKRFCQTVGLDPKRPILLYLGSSKNIAPDESWFVERVREYFRESGKGGLADIQFLIRPHPANAEVFERVECEDVRIWPKGGGLPESPEEFQMMRSSMAHSVATLGINTSAMIDSVLADKPTYTVKIKRYKNTQSNAVHFRYLMDAGALHICQDIGEFAVALRSLMKGADPKEPERRAFAQSFARPAGLDRSAGEVIAARVIELSNRCSAWRR